MLPTSDLEVAFGTDVSLLTPTISISEGAAISPENETALDFTNPVTYTVTAEDSTTIQDWTVTITVAPNNETDILSFSILTHVRKLEKGQYYTCSYVRNSLYVLSYNTNIFVPGTTDCTINRVVTLCR